MNWKLEVREGDRAARGHDGIFIRHRGMRLEIDHPAGKLNHECARCDIPEADLAFDVGIEPSACHVDDVERGTSDHPGLACGTHHLAEDGESRSDGAHGL